MVERRNSTRYAIWFPVTLERDGTAAWAICNDASVGGVLISSATKIEIGAEVIVTFRVAPDEPERRVSGRVVRFDGEAEDPRSVFPYRVAVEFKEETRELEDRFRRASERPPGPPSTPP